jgi:Fic family protein
MIPEDFVADQQPFVVRTTDGHWAFVPPPLPPVLDMSALAAPLVRASTAVGELKGAARLLPNPYMLVNALQRREALTSSAMEGTITTIDNLLLEEAQAQLKPDEDAREAFNYVRALRFAVESLKTLPIGHRIITGAHERLLGQLSAQRGARKRPGQYKAQQNAIGRPGDSLATARFVPTPPAETPDCMAALERFINRPDQGPEERLLDIALAHYQFEAIHPFDDGNGRIGRMIVTLMAIQSGLVDMPLLHVSPRIEKSKNEYVDRLFRASTEGDWTGWVTYFLRVVEDSATDALSTTTRTLDLQKSMRDRAKAAGKSARLPMIVDAMFESPWTTVSTMADRCHVTYPTAQKDLQALVSAGLLHELPERQPRIFFAPEIIRISDRQ